jgi:outer membrane lipoprotein-sorting protein
MIIILTSSTMVLGSLQLSAQDATEIMEKSHIAYYYAGDDSRAEVHMQILNKKGKEREREFTMLRLDEADGGDQKYYIYFKQPSDVARLTFMVHKSAESNDLRWIYVPSVDLVKPISADDNNSSFVGSDFSYEDVSGRHWSEDNHLLVSESEIDGHKVWVLESTPVNGSKNMSRKVSYIRKDDFLPMKEEYYNRKGELVRQFTADKVEVIGGIPSVTVRTMENVKKQQHTTVEFRKIEYNIGLKPEVFTERYLKNPPRDLIR